MEAPIAWSGTLVSHWISLSSQAASSSGVFLTALEFIGQFLRSCHSYVWSCDCHYDLLHDKALLEVVEDSVINLWNTCPCRVFRSHKVSGKELLSDSRFNFNSL